MSNSHVWAEMEEEVTELVKDVYDKVKNVWEELYGGDHEIVAERTRSFIDKIKEYLASLEQESEEEKRIMIKKIEDLLHDNKRLSKELNMESDFDFGDRTPLSEVYHKLYNTVVSLSRLKKERTSKYRALKEQELKLCTVLDCPTMLAVLGVATELELNNLEARLHTLKEQKVQLEKALHALRSKIAVLLDDLGVSPLLTIEKFCKEGNESLLPLNKDTYCELKKLLEKMESQRLGAIEEAEQLRGRLNVLWDRVLVSHAIREAVLSRCKGHSKDEINKLKEEVNRCEELKRQNLKVYIDKVKEELVDWWDRCCYSDQQKTLFRPFYETHHSEELLMLLELELEKTRDFYLKYENIFQLAAKRQKMWEHFRKLEASTKDTNRLFTNRGGALLREEKERKTIQKELPKIEDRLMRFLSEFEEKENRSFCLYGNDLRDEIKRCWVEWHTKKDSEKIARKAANVQNLVLESKLGTLQQTAGVKRKMATPLARNNLSNKIRKAASNTSVNTCAGSSDALSSCGTEKSATSSKVMSARRVLQTPTLLVPPTPQVPLEGSMLSTYSVFQEHLEDMSKASHVPCRSTLTPGPRVLRSRNAQTPLHSSPKTPRMTPYSRRAVATTSKTPHKSPFKVGKAPLPSISRIPTVMPTKSPRPLSQLKTPRRNLPIII